MSQAQVCPVCGGRGNMPAEFYERKYPYGTPHTTAYGGVVVCKSCNGSGFVIVP